MDRWADDVWLEARSNCLVFSECSDYERELREGIESDEEKGVVRIENDERE